MVCLVTGCVSQRRDRRYLSDYAMKIHTLVAPTYAILVFSSITHSLAQNTTSSAVKSATPQLGI
jgi:hypothetical protein